MKTVLVFGGLYLAFVGAMQYVSATGGNTPTADTLSQLPALPTATGNLVLGGGLALFGGQLARAVGRVV